MLLRLEIVCFLLSFGYILFYVSDIVRLYFHKLQQKRREKLERLEVREKKREEQEAITVSAKDKEEDKKDGKKVYITPEAGEQIREIAKRAHVNISRWYFETARSLIVEWLALKKQDKDLNLLLADVYEREKKFQNAAYIYQDMLVLFPWDLYILQRLWNVHALLWENEKAFEVYEKAFECNKSNTEVLDILAHLALELKEYKKSLKYANMYLKEKPRNAEKLGLKWYCLEKLGKNIEAIKSYEQVLQLQPYNTEIQDRVIALEKQ
jgi:tetratricopeptide (TPR) repeat protein